MNLLDKIAGRIGYTPAKQVAVLRQALKVRSFEAAAVNRMTADWNIATASIDSDIRSGGIAVRNRARNLAQNNDYVKRYLTLARVNVVGPNGFKLQMNVRELAKNAEGKWTWMPDEMANMLLEQGFAEWAKRQNASVNGRLSFHGISEQVVRYVLRDGEALIRIIRNKKLPYGFTLQAIDPSFLDEQYSERFSDGRVVKMGVELDITRRPVAYYFRAVDPVMELYGVQSLGGYRTRVPADEIIHVFDQEFENQTRGISWIVQSMLRLKMLAGYEEAALVNARVSAAKMGFFTSKTDEGGGEFTGETDASGNVMITGEPGSMDRLPDGLDFKPWSPEYPSAQHEMFVKSILRGISSGLNVSYNMMANDLERVNYSSIRAGLLDERDMWKLVQNLLVEQFLQPVFVAWLEMALVTKSINLPIEKIKKFESAIWVGRRWAWVDPLKDVQAKKEEVQAGFTTRTQVVAEQGDDIAELDAELAGEKNRAEALGLTLSVYQPEAKQIVAPAQPADEPPQEDAQGNLLREAEELLSRKSNGNH